MNSEIFYFDGIKSSDLGVYLVNVGGGLLTHSFLPEREIISESIPNNDIPYVYGYKKNSLAMPLTLTLIDEKWTLEKRRQIATWLDRDYFCEFYRQDFPEVRYYLSYEGGVDLTHNGADDGYINVQMKNISPHAYSPIMTENIHHNSTTPVVYEFKNIGDANIYPEMQIKKIGDGDLSIVNQSNGGKEFKFNNLLNNETVYVDNLNRHIETDISLTNRYDDFNGDYLELVYGVNRLEISGQCEITFRYQYTIKG